MTGRQLSVMLVIGAVLLFVCSCGEASKSGSTDIMAPDVVAKLCTHIIENRQKMIVDTNQTPVVWSDGAILEVGTNYPSGLQKLISRPTHYHKIRAFVDQLGGGVGSQWKDASVAPSSSDKRYATIRSSDGKIETSVESLYVEYLGERYPTATIRIRGKLEPIVFLVDGQVRASLMPVKFDR